MRNAAGEQRRFCAGSGHFHTVLGIKKTLLLFSHLENVFHLELFTQVLGFKKVKRRIFHLELPTPVGVVKQPFFTWGFSH
jgi:hypothetical protein